MGRSVVALHFFPHSNPEVEIISLLGERIELHHISCHEDLGAMAAHIRESDGKVDAIALVNVPRKLHLGIENVAYEQSERLFEMPKKTPIFDGEGIKSAIERWGIYLADEREPGLWTRKRILMIPGLNHSGLVEGLSQFSSEIRYADPSVYFNLPSALGIGSKETLGAVANRTLDQLQQFDVHELFPRPTEEVPHGRSSNLYEWADVLAGDIGAIRRFAPLDLSRKTIVTNWVSDVDVEDLTERGVSILVTLLPNLSHDDRFYAHHGAAELEACLAVLIPSGQTIGEHSYLNQLTQMEWKPAVRYLRPEEANLNRFAFVSQPLTNETFQGTYPWTRFVPRPLLNQVVPFVPPSFVGRLEQITSRSTDYSAEAIVLTLGGTPEAFESRDNSFVYRRLLQAAHMAERLDARMLGVSALSESMGEAAERVSHKTDIAITSGRSLTLAATLDSARSNVVAIGRAKTKADIHIVILNASRPDSATSARYLAQYGHRMTLVASRPEHLAGLKRRIEEDHPETSIRISNSANAVVGDAHLIVSTLSAQDKPNGPLLDLRRVEPGTVICDLGRSPLIAASQATSRPDLLFVHGVEMNMPSTTHTSVPVGLSPHTVPAALAEAAALSLEGRFEDFSLDREPNVDRLKEIIGLCRTHGIEIAFSRSYTALIEEDQIQGIRREMARLQDNEQAKQLMMAGSEPVATESSVVPTSGTDIQRPDNGTLILGALGLVAIIGGIFTFFMRRRRGDQES